jgi:RimJ/RimL family protein N-acetyltransferase
VERGDLPTLFRFQCDPDANGMAGTKPRGEAAFFAVWEKILADTAVEHRAIMLDGAVVGTINCFQADGVDAVGYWIDKEHWGKGVASRALELFVKECARRPLHATAAKDNAASIRVLERCGFRCTGTYMGEETERYTAREVATFVLVESNQPLR